MEGTSLPSSNQKYFSSAPATKQDIERARAQAEHERKEREWREGNSRGEGAATQSVRALALA